MISYMTTMTAMNNLSGMQSDLGRDCAFFAEYASNMLGCGATCSRIQKNIRRMASATGYSVELTILPAHCIVTLSDAEGLSYSHSSTIADLPNDYALNTRLSNLSWRVAENKVSLKEAETEFPHLLKGPRYSRLTLLLLVAAANAAFCRIFGGDIMATGIVAIATLIGFSFKILLSAQHVNYMAVTAASAFAAAVVGTAGYVFPGITSTEDVALATSVLFLIPGIPYINSVNDLLTDHYLCAFSRFVKATIITACITVGLTAAFLLMKISFFDL